MNSQLKKHFAFSLVIMLTLITVKSNSQQLSSGLEHSAVILNDKSLWTWGGGIAEPKVV